MLCSCAVETESTDHFFIRCQNYVSFRTALMTELSSIIVKSKQCSSKQVLF